MIGVGSRVGGYTVIRLLGQGGMGQVYLAQHPRIARRVAVKVLLSALSSNEGLIERFFTEARATSLIKHPGIVEVLDCDVLEGQAYIVMEYLAGESLAGYLDRTGGLLGDAGFALAVVGQVADAVAAAHAAGIVHRDLKPDNVFLCANPQGRRVVPKVLDFGIAKVAQQGTPTQTATGALIGTPTYMSPEQCRGGSKLVDGRSDVYSLGCILYEAICGRPPFVREGTGDLIVAHVSERADDPRALVPELPPTLADLAMRMLAKNPEDRPQTMIAVSAEIATSLQLLGVRRPIAEIEPIRPVLLPPVEDDMVLPASAAAVRASRPTEVQPRDPASSRTPLAPAGETRMLTPAVTSANPTTLRGTVGERSTYDLAPRRRMGWGIGAMAVLAIGGLAAALVLWRPKPPPIASRESEREVRPVAATPVPPPRTEVTIDVRGLPEGAEILVDGKLTHGPPMVLARDDRSHLIVLHATGYDDRKIAIEADRDQILDVTMTAARTPGGEKTGGRDTKPRPVHRSKLPPPAAMKQETEHAVTPKTPPTNEPKKSAYDEM
ncbi:MAG TPA: serine/threonine-protein kinase [Polyangia bacterium]|nr:serine/threonine-protein kinase [Polyangia bacterium]